MERILIDMAQVGFNPFPNHSFHPLCLSILTGSMRVDFVIAQVEAVQEAVGDWRGAFDYQG